MYNFTLKVEILELEIETKDEMKEIIEQLKMDQKFKGINTEIFWWLRSEYYKQYEILNNLI